MKFTIEKVSKLTGFPAATLRNWEKRYGFPQPVRSDSGHRFYLSHDVEFLKKVKDWLSTDYTLAEVATFYKSHVQQQSSVSDSVRTVQDFETDVDFRVNLLFEALLEYDIPAAVIHYSILNAKLGPEDLFSRVFLPILRRSSEALQTKEITRVQSHFAMTFVRIRLASFVALFMPPTREPRVLCALISESADELGMALIAGHLKFRGYSVQLLGPQMELADILEASRSLQPDCLVLTYTDVEVLRKDFPLISKSKIPVCLSLFRTSMPCEGCDVLEKFPKNIYISRHTQSFEAADFIEMLVQSHR